MLSLRYAANVPHSLSEYTQRLLSELCEPIGIEVLNISSTVRTVSSQANQMFRDIVNHGTAKELRLYGKAGRAVVKVYQDSLKAGLGAEEIVSRMRAQIAKNPEAISHHLKNPLEVNVFDVPKQSILPSKIRGFVDAFQHDALYRHRISKFFEPPKDYCYHIEIVQRYGASGGW